MSSNPALSLLFGSSVGEPERTRITHAFKLFCAVFGFDPAGGSNAPTLCYANEASDPRQLSLHAGYFARTPSKPAPVPTSLNLGEKGLNVPSRYANFPCFHGTKDGEPDWLGEIFEWVSGAHEYSITERDGVGRIPFSQTLHGRFGLNPEIPFAAVAMCCLNQRIRRVAGGNWPDRPQQPWENSIERVYATTHDIDFLPTSFGATCHRLAKNIAIGLLVHRDIRLAASITWTAVRRLLGGPHPLNCLPGMCRRERQLGIRSTCTVIARREHRRDANYSLKDRKTQRTLSDLVEAGVEIGVHGSYTSLDQDGGLAEEYRRLAHAGFRPVGGRQHWLRYCDDRLFEQLRVIGARYDCTAGYSSRPGFRHGACFPFPPYDFSRESAYPLLELPLVLMDGAIYDCNHDPASWPDTCRRVLSASRHFGWGGLSVLWHDTVFHGAQLPRGIAELYWQLPAEKEAWLGCAEVVRMVWHRYADAGLLPAEPPSPSENPP